MMFLLASLHIGHSCIHAMAISRVGAGHTGVHVIEAQSMCPTVKHVHAIVSHHVHCWCGWCAWHWCWRWTGLSADGSIGTMFNRGVHEVELCKSHGVIGNMIPKLGCHKFAKALFVFISEMLAEFNEHLIGHQLNLPHVTGSGEHASCLNMINIKSLMVPSVSRLPPAMEMCCTL